MKFWKFCRDSITCKRELRLDGVISDDSTWFDDTITPEEFRRELNASDGNITVWINSEGGDLFAATEIYNMLKAYRGKVTVKIDAIAASAASVVAMAGDVIEISPVGIMMIHNPSTYAEGDSAEMKIAARMLDEVKETIINAYELKTKLPREQLAQMMDDETWIHAGKAVKLGFADKIIGKENQSTEDTSTRGVSSKRQVKNHLWNVIKAKCAVDEANKKGVKVSDLRRRLEDSMKRFNELN